MPVRFFIILLLTVCSNALARDESDDSLDEAFLEFLADMENIDDRWTHPIDFEEINDEQIHPVNKVTASEIRNE